MSTVQIHRPPASIRPRRAVTGPLTRSSRAGALLLLALLVVIVYAAFDHGATSTAAGARIEVAVAVVAAVAAAAWLGGGILQVRAPRATVAGIGLLACYAAWSGASLAWSVAPDQTWIELNRLLMYVVVLWLAVAVGASQPRAIELAGKGFLGVVVAVTLYALGQKVLPGLHVPGVFDLNQTGLLPRLQEPFGYWNALALFVAMGVPIAIALSLDRLRTARARLSALACAELMLLTIGLTYSRGGVLALVAGTIIGVALAGDRLRWLLWLTVVCVATVPPLVFGLSAHSVTGVHVPLSTREQGGAELLGVLLVSLLALWFAGSRLIDVEDRVRVGPERARRIGRLLLLAAGVAVVCAVLAVAVSSRGFTGTFSHAWNSFTTTRSASVYDPHRFLSADSENRWVWWKEAAGAFSDQPLRGWGAGSFGVVHLLYRHDALSVQNSHSFPLQLLADTGIVGALLGLGAWALLIVGGVRGVRRHGLAPGRPLAAALFAGAVMYAVHALYDWDWDIPGITLPALVLLGVLAGSSARRSAAAEVTAAGSGGGLRALALAGCSLALCLFAFSGVLPALAASKASSALVLASRSTPASLRDADATAALASSLDPLSDAGLRAQATVATNRGRLGAARADLQNAIARNPTDIQAWAQLAELEITLRDHQAALTAAGRLLQLDPLNHAARVLAAQVELLQTPPTASPTATPVPGG